MQILKKLRNVNQQLLSIKTFSSAPAENFAKSSVKVARTALTNPRDHTSDHYGMWYTVDPEIAKCLYSHAGFTKAFKEVKELFYETSLMIREPAVSIIDLIKKSKLHHPPNKFVLYGSPGTGKTMSLAHIKHYLHDEGWIIVHVSAPSLWSSSFKEIVPSLTRTGFYDHTIDASKWLTHFQQQNSMTLNKLGLLTSAPYTWTLRDVTEKGSPLSSVIEFGISRPRYASECVYHLNTELKNYAKEGRIKVAVVVDGINAFFSPVSKFLTDDKTVVNPNLFTLHQAFLQYFNNDWKNGCVIGAVDITMSTTDRRKSYLPRYLLRKWGWDTLDPLVPIKVESYSEAEFQSAVDYYIDRKLLLHRAAGSLEGREELEFTSGRNPEALMKLAVCH